jgi:hypothetical protein
MVQFALLVPQAHLMVLYAISWLLTLKHICVFMVFSPVALIV